MIKREPWTLFSFDGKYVRKMTPQERYRATELFKGESAREAEETDE